MDEGHNGIFQDSIFCRNWKDSSISQRSTRGVEELSSFLLRLDVVLKGKNETYAENKALILTFLFLIQGENLLVKKAKKISETPNISTRIKLFILLHPE
jgi:hypothetical protein